MAKPAATIKRYVDLRPVEAVALGLDDVFFATSTTQTFASDEERENFRERWLGRYLSGFPELAFVAMDGDAVAGYLVGADVDPATSAAFAGFDDFADLATLTARFPAHLHINVAAPYRNQGLGAHLLGAFCDALETSGTAGVHVVTARGARNVGFYRRNGFVERASTGLGTPKTLVFLGRALNGQRHPT